VIAEQTLKNELLVRGMYAGTFINKQKGIDFEKIKKNIDNNLSWPHTIACFGPLHQEDQEAVKSTILDLTHEPEKLAYFNTMNEIDRCVIVAGSLQGMNKDSKLYFRCKQIETKNDVFEHCIHMESEYGFGDKSRQMTESNSFRRGRRRGYYI
jgi:hypothetical protein